MNTPSHLLIGAAVFARRDSPKVTFAAMAGGVVPDLCLMAMVAWSLWVLRIPTGVVFDQLYFSDQWQQVFAIDHNFFLWGGLFTLAKVRHMPRLYAFAGAGLLHAGVDFLVHHDDARRQLWPLTNFAFHSPVSYWDRAHFGGIVAPVEAGLDIMLAMLLVLRLTRVWERATTMISAALVVLPILAFGLYHLIEGRAVMAHDSAAPAAHTAP